jgi:hypothetical protein
MVPWLLLCNRPLVLRAVFWFNKHMREIRRQIAGEGVISDQFSRAALLTGWRIEMVNNRDVYERARLSLLKAEKSLDILDQILYGDLDKIAQKYDSPQLYMIATIAGFCVKVEHQFNQ